MRYHGKHIFFQITGEDLSFGWFPKWHAHLRWKSAEDGLTWIRPYFGVYGY